MLYLLSSIYLLLLITMTDISPSHDAADPITAQVILIHGLHMHAFAMKPLAKKLTAHGFDCYCFGYHSVIKTIADHSKRLNDWLARHFEQHSHFYLVGHSLGGLVIRDFIERYPDWVKTGRIERIVTLGTPHAGSQVANHMVKYIPTFIGKSYQGALDGSLPVTLSQVDIGVIAGNKPAGLGSLMMKKDWRQQPNDGTVFVSETYFAHQKQHITLPYSHTGLILSDEVAKQTAHFLRYGQFN